MLHFDKFLVVLDQPLSKVLKLSKLQLKVFLDYNPPLVTDIINLANNKNHNSIPIGQHFKNKLICLDTATVCIDYHHIALEYATQNCLALILGA